MGWATASVKGMLVYHFELLGWDPWKNENLLTLLCYF